MNNDTSQEPTVVETSNTIARKRSVISVVAQYLSLPAIVISVIFVVGFGSKALAGDTKSIIVDTAIMVCLGLYPLIMGLLLRRQALNNNRNYRSSYLIFMGSGAFMGWLGLIIPIPILVGGFDKTIQNPGLAFYILSLFFSAVLLISGIALFMMGLGLGREAEAASAFPDR
jgi:hypothetical protein